MNDIINDIRFRVALESEHDELVKLGKTSLYTGDFSNRQMFSHDKAYAEGWIRVATVNGEIVGFTCVRHKTRWPETMLYFIVVRPDMRSLGLGEQMIEQVMANSPHNTMRLNVMKENTGAVKFYRRLGFKLAGYSLDGQAWSMVKEWPAE